MVAVGLIEKVRFKQKLEGGKEISQEVSGGKLT